MAGGPLKAMMLTERNGSGPSRHAAFAMVVDALPSTRRDQKILCEFVLVRNLLQQARNEALLIGCRWGLLGALAVTACGGVAVQPKRDPSTIVVPEN